MYSNTELHIRVIYNWKLGLTLTLSLSLSLDSFSVHFLSCISSTNKACLASKDEENNNNSKKIK